jgi:hypothetical protein
MKMPFAIAALGLVLLSGCAMLGLKKPSCADEKKVVQPVAAFIASPAGLDCMNAQAIADDLESFMGTLGLCQAPPHGMPQTMEGPIGSLVCPPLVAWAVSHYVDNSERLKKWECKGTGVKAAFMAACQFIPI